MTTDSWMRILLRLSSSNYVERPKVVFHVSSPCVFHNSYLLGSVFCPLPWVIAFASHKHTNCPSSLMRLQFPLARGHPIFGLVQYRPSRWLGRSSFVKHAIALCSSMHFKNQNLVLAGRLKSIAGVVFA